MKLKGGRFYKKIMIKFEENFDNDETRVRQFDNQNKTRHFVEAERGGSGNQIMMKEKVREREKMLIVDDNHVKVDCKAFRTQFSPFIFFFFFREDKNRRPLLEGGGGG